MFTKSEIVLLNRRATNQTRARHDEQGIDWNYWSFYPARDGHEGVFTDGHDHSILGDSAAPHEGWTLDEPFVLEDEAVVGLLRGLSTEQHQGRRIAQPARRADREVLASDQYRRLRALEKLLIVQDEG